MSAFKILIAVDGSDNACRAVNFLIGQLPLYKAMAEIHLLNVHAPIASGNVRHFITAEALDRYYREEGEAALATARELLDGAGVPYQHHINVGDVAETVAAYAKEHSCQMILMGARGLNAIVGLLMGSITTRVLHLATVPVVIIK